MFLQIRQKLLVAGIHNKQSERFFAEWYYSLSIEYYDSIKSLSNSYSVIG